jgi:hypothetical protein
MVKDRRRIVKLNLDINKMLGEKDDSGTVDGGVGMDSGAGAH